MQIAENIYFQVSKYLIILIFGIYILSGFRSLSAAQYSRSGKHFNGTILILVFHFLAALTIFIGEPTMSHAIIYAAQLLILVFIYKAYTFVYKGLSYLVLNNMLLLLSLGFIMLLRLKESYCIRQMIFAFVSAIVSLFIPILIDKFKHFDKFGLFYCIAGICLLGLVLLFGNEHYGAKNWISIGPVSLQPSEFVKILYAFFLASFLYKDASFKRVIITSVFAAVHVLLLVAARDLGSALLFFITWLFVITAASGHIIYLAEGTAIGAGASIAAYHLFSHVRVRVKAFLDPFSSIDSSGYQMAQSLFAIGTWGWFGAGLTRGMPEKIPVVESDFIFSAIAEELGTVFAILLIVLELSCFIMFVNAAMKMTNSFYKLAAFGLSVEYIFQVFLNIGGVTGFIPSTGVTLPLISYGGSSCVCTIIMFSIIQGMYVLSKENSAYTDSAENFLKEGAAKDYED
ncbi:MAG: FtsW/RodA/SpoVE family cell cycle protein [Lachnospiraceae bacterium]|jgi:cell division protein FtsW (lipid II flippase)|nr:FtsW/RodA/SpoVE family cell cycle protein [Lachnospiraceae bacterium]MEE3460887.1 FtsW/RodA/SpoVE family cell cycle protein [Lachnospiraceae bacterium]